MGGQESLSHEVTFLERPDYKREPTVGRSHEQPFQVQEEVGKGSKGGSKLCLLTNSNGGWCD